MPEKRHDRKSRGTAWWSGFAMSLVVNLALYFVVSSFRNNVFGNSSLTVETERLLFILPWAINAGVLFVGFILRPEFAVGWLGFFAAILITVSAIGVLFVAGCFIFLGLGAIFSGGCPTMLLTLLIPTFAVLKKGKRIWFIGCQGMVLT